MGKSDDGLERTATVVGLAADLKELIVTFINLIAAILGGLTSYTLAIQPNKTYLYTDIEASVSYSRFFWNLDDELIDRWFHRIQKLLHEQGSVTVRDLCHFINDRNAKEIAQAAWALDAFFRQYQIQYDLIRDWIYTGDRSIELVVDHPGFAVKNARMAYRL